MFTDSNYFIISSSSGRIVYYQLTMESPSTVPTPKRGAASLHTYMGCTAFGLTSGVGLGWQPAEQQISQKTMWVCTLVCPLLNQHVDPRALAHERLAVSLESRQHHILIFSSGHAGILNLILGEICCSSHCHQRPTHLCQAKGGAAHDMQPRRQSPLGWAHLRAAPPSAGSARCALSWS